MFWPKAHIETAANGHLVLNWPTAGHLFYILLCAWLRLRYGVRRTGRQIVSPDDVILRDFVGKGLRLKSGWDNWSGDYLLSEDQAGDMFLSRLAAFPISPSR